MREFFPIYEEAVSHIGMTLHPIPLNFLIYEENFISFFINVPLTCSSMLSLTVVPGSFFITTMFDEICDNCAKKVVNPEKVYS
jgi:hypothetical protein